MAIRHLAPGMAESVRQVWKDTIVVADKFHVIQLFSKYLERARKRSTFQGSHKQGRHAQRLLHTPPSRLKPFEKEELDQWFKQDKTIHCVYHSLQNMRSVYNCPSEIGVSALSEWISTHLFSPIPVVRSIAKTIIQWRSEIEAYFTYRYTNARIEGTHNRIKVLKRRAYGYRNMQRFATRIRLECKTA